MELKLTDQKQWLDQDCVVSVTSHEKITVGPIPGQQVLSIQVTHDDALQVLGEILRSRLDILRRIFYPLENLLQEACSSRLEKGFSLGQTIPSSYDYADSVLRGVLEEIGDSAAKKYEPSVLERLMSRFFGKQDYIPELLEISTFNRGFQLVLGEAVQPIRKVVEACRRNGDKSFCDIEESDIQKMAEDIHRYLVIGNNGVIGGTNAVNAYYKNGIDAWRNIVKEHGVKRRDHIRKKVEELRELVEEKKETLPNPFWLSFADASLLSHGKQGRCPITQKETFEACLRLYVKAGAEAESRNEIDLAAVLENNEA